MLSITTDELSTEPQSSLRRILRFIGATPDWAGLLEGGQLPLLNPARSKGRKNVAAPNWSDELKQKTIDLISPSVNVSWPAQAALQRLELGLGPFSDQAFRSNH